MQSKIKKKGKHVDQNEMEERIKYHLAQASFSVKRLNLTIKLVKINKKLICLYYF